MPQVTGDRFSSQSMSDCAFCPPEGRRFRTSRQCAQCSRPLCLGCRVPVPGTPFLCPECGGGPCEDALHVPGAAVERLQAAGHAAPYWLLVLHERSLAAASPEQVEAELVPE